MSTSFRLFSIACCLLLSASVFADKQTLTVYTYDSFISDWGPGPQVKIAFEVECDCELNFVGLEDGVSLLSRLKLEGSNTRADVVLGLDTNLTAEARATGLFQAHGLSLEKLNATQRLAITIFSYLTTSVILPLYTIRNYCRTHRLV